VKKKKKSSSFLIFFIYPLLVIVVGNLISYIFFDFNIIAKLIEWIRPKPALYVTATVDNVNPPQYTKVTLAVFVKDKNNNPVSDAKVIAIAHYRTTDTIRQNYADDKGKALIYYNIYRATVGYKVIIDIKAKKGKASGSAKASFIPISGEQ